MEENSPNQELPYNASDFSLPFSIFALSRKYEKT